MTLYCVGKEIIDLVNDRMRKLIDNGDNVQGFVTIYTGLGLGALILERMDADYAKKNQN